MADDHGLAMALGSSIVQSIAVRDGARPNHAMVFLTSQVVMDLHQSSVRLWQTAGAHRDGDILLVWKDG